MRKMIIQSETDSEDMAAAIHINNITRQTDCGQVIWFSNMGKKLAYMDILNEHCATLKKEVEFLKLRDESLSKKISEMDQRCRKLEAKLESVLIAKREKVKGSDGQKNESEGIKAPSQSH